MPILTSRLTDSIARNLTPPEAGYVIHWCPKTPGFGVRVSSGGLKTWLSERRIDGRTVRRPLGRAAGRGAISADIARKLQIEVSGELLQGVDRLEVSRERKAQAAIDSLTFGAALKEYVKNKRRAKDGLPLKARTKSDYLDMIAPVKAAASGKPTLGGALLSIAETPVTSLTGDRLRSLYKALESRGVRRQAYAMQVVRAVLRYFGITVPENPFSPDSPGRDRIMIASSEGNPSPIPPAHLGAWWLAATEMGTTTADQLCVLLLTGCRPEEVAELPVEEVDVATKRFHLHDTKNRTDHDVFLSRQALKIVKRNLKGKKKGEKVFGVGDPRSTLEAINRAAGAGHVTPKQLRHTFASIAEELVSVYQLKRMINHLTTGDVTGTHYVGVNEERLRAGWQAVANYIERAAKKAAARKR